jgi:hypothetical protein
MLLARIHKHLSARMNSAYCWPLLRRQERSRGPKVKLSSANLWKLRAVLSVIVVPAEQTCVPGRGCNRGFLSCRQRNAPLESIVSVDRARIERAHASIERPLQTRPSRQGLWLTLLVVRSARRYRGTRRRLDGAGAWAPMLDWGQHPLCNWPRLCCAGPSSLELAVLL